MLPFASWLSSARRPLRPTVRRRHGFRPTIEVLEGRLVPATFLVTNTLDAGAGSLRQAILNANAKPNVGGVADRIEFKINGPNTQIALQSSLPDVKEAVVIDAT